MGKKMQKGASKPGFFSMKVNPKGMSVGNLVSNVKGVKAVVTVGAKKMGAALSKMKSAPMKRGAIKMKKR